MNSRSNNVLEKSRQVKDYGKSRIDQLKEEMAERQQQQGLMEEEIPDDDFIEDDVADSDEEKPSHIRKKIHTSARARVIVPANSSIKQDHASLEQRQKREEQSKAVMESLIKEKLPEPHIEEVARLQNQFKNSSYARFKDRPGQQAPVAKEGYMDRLLYSKHIPKISTGQIQDQKNLDFFLLDAVEDMENLSALYLFGKVAVGRQFANACVQITNMCREVFIMPRRGFSVDEVEQEIREMIGSLKSLAKVDISFSHVFKKYCFELDVDYRNEEVEVLKLSYSYKSLGLNNFGPTGRTFKGVFGTGMPSLEQFLINSQTQGPCWLQLQNFEVVPQSTFSDQLLNIRLNDFRANLRMNAQQPPAPLLTLLTFQTLMNSDNRIIDAVYLSLYSQFAIEENRYEAVDHILVHTKGLELKAEPKSDHHRAFLNLPQDSEYTLLNTVQSLFSKLNPDVIIGHELFAGVLDVYLTKLNQVGVESLNLLSRCCIDPKRLRSLTMRNIKNKMNNIFAGRLLLDTYALAREFLKLDEYTLQNIVAHLNKDTGVLAAQTPEIELRSAAEQIKDILIKLQLLPLTLQLSKVAGCLWQTSLKQARAERNEVLLLHKFFANNYILPDRQKFEKDDEYEEEKGYTGGLVLEPKSGFYDSYIVLVDFNSLYPSIIRHYKICFTTVARQFRNLEKGERAPAEAIQIEAEIFEEQFIVKPVNEIVLSAPTEPLLPQILSMLISKRKEVKNMMKYEKSSSMLKQLDIKQQAYKLIANSIYGCLGFSYSRFYSKKMAALITHFGRSLLKSSEELITGQGFSVIYGDTDSLMVNTLKSDLIEAIATGLTLKQEINNQFKKNRESREQILEVELDGVFKKLLLLKKKKYAALTVTNYMEIAQSKIEGVPEQTKLEIKGMDMIRRDWSKLTKDSCLVVLNMLMNVGTLDDVYNYLESVNRALNVIASIDDPTNYVPVENNSVAQTEPMSKSKQKTTATKSGLLEEETTDVLPMPTIEIKDFVIKRQLGKRPSEYGDTSGQPHVRVAIWMKEYFKKTDEQLLNHFIPFVITTRGSALGEKAMHIEEYYGQFYESTNNNVMKIESKTIYHIDIPWYKNNQLLNPIHRMLEVIEGHSEDRLKLIFELRSVENNEPEEKKYSIYDAINRVQVSLPFIYRNLTTDIEEFKVKCFFCHQKCYAFLPLCPNTVDGLYNMDVYRNRLSTVLSALIRNFYMFQRKCQECSYTATQFKADGSCCIHHEGKRMKALSSPKEISEKITYFKELCIVLADYETQTGAEQRRREIVNELMTPVVNENYYESKGMMYPFRFYSNGNKIPGQPDLVSKLC